MHGTEAATMVVVGEFTVPEGQLVGQEQSPHVGGMCQSTGAEVVQVGLGRGHDLNLHLAVPGVEVLRGVAVADVADVQGTLPVDETVVAAAVGAIRAVDAEVRVAPAVPTAAAVQALSVGAGAATVPAATAARQRLGTVSERGRSLGPPVATRAAVVSVAALDAVLVEVPVGVAA